MLNKSEEELESFYPSDEIVKDYGEALMKFKSDGFIYPFTHEEEKEMIKNTEKQLVYDEGVDAGIKKGIEQNKIDVIKNMLLKNITIEDIADIVNISTVEVEKIIR